MKLREMSSKVFWSTMIPNEQSFPKYLFARQPTASFLTCLLPTPFYECQLLCDPGTTSVTDVHPWLPEIHDLEVDKDKSTGPQYTVRNYVMGAKSWGGGFGQSPIWAKF